MDRDENLFCTRGRDVFKIRMIEEWAPVRAVTG